VKLIFFEVRTPEQIPLAIAAISQSAAQAICVLPDAQLVVHRATLLARIQEVQEANIAGCAH
jgi:hypothetical protein